MFDGSERHNNLGILGEGGHNQYPGDVGRFNICPGDGDINSWEWEIIQHISPQGRRLTQTPLWSLFQDSSK